MSDRKTVMLIDGHAMAYRAYHAIPPLTSPTGEPTNATFGYANMLLKAIDDLRPDYVVATFDRGKTFRHEDYAEYKATRAETPHDLRAQFGRIQEFTRTLGIPIYEMEGYEADDLLGTLSKKAADQGLDAIIVTGDSDTFQLITPSISVLYPSRSIGDVKLYDVEAIRERYGLEPRQLIDLKALTGDSSDNIPGVRGVGIKTATTLLQKHGTLEAIYAHLDEIKQTRFRSALEAGHDSALLSQHLVTIIRDLGVELDLEQSVWGTFDRDQVMALLRELGFHTLAARIPGREAAGGEQLGLFGADVGAPAEPVVAMGTGAYRVINSAEALSRLVATLSGAERFAIDTETTSTDAMRTALVGLSLSHVEGEAVYIPVGHDRRLTRDPQLDLAMVREKLGPVLADERITKVMHNAKFDLLVLDQQGLTVGGPCLDTMLAAWLLAPSGRGIGLKEQAWQRLGVEMTPITDLIGTGRSQITMDKVPISKAAPYACADADTTLRLWNALRPELRSLNLEPLLVEMEMPLVPVLISMEKHGMVVDGEYLKGMSRQMGERIAELTTQIYSLAGHPFNVKSTKQLGVVLFEELGLPVGRKTQTGASTAADVLEELRAEHAIIPLIEEHRQIEKIKGTYVDALPALINPQTGRVHTSFNQTGASTGRLSSSDPNLQNIPVRSELGRQVRGAFVAPEGQVLLGCDYSQVELRLLAHLSQDPELMGAFFRDEDVHASTASAILGVPLDQVSYEQRSLAKAINFGLMYGMSEFGLAARTDLDAAQAKEFISTYFGRFKQVKAYLDGTIRFARENGYVETILGRRRLFPELRGGGRGGAARAAERAAVNMPIQGSAADIIKIAMINLHRELQGGRLSASIVLQVHDELVLEVPESELDETRDLVVGTMSNAYKLSVPLKVDAAIGHNWMEMKAQ